MNLLLKFLLMVSTLFFCHMAHSICSKQEVQQMRMGGMKDYQINRICGQNNVPQQPMTNICQTPQMWCRLNQFGYVNSSCWCATQYGPVTGVTVPAR